MPGIYFEEKNSNKLLFRNSARFETKLTLLYGIIAFIFPFLSSNQLIVGTIVNALLIKSAIDLKSKNALLLSIIPSLAAFSAGFLFGSLTHQAILMLPFIWAGNLALMVLIRKYFVKGKKEFLYTNLIAATSKTAVLFLSAAALFAMSLAPAIVLTAFGIMQFATAILGGLLFIGATKTAGKLRNFAKTQ